MAMAVTRRSPLSPSLDDERFMFAFAHDARAHLRTILTRIQLVQRHGGATLPEEDQGLLSEAAKAVEDVNSLLSGVLTLLNPEESEEETGLHLLLQGTLIELKSSLTESQAEVEVQNSLEVPVPARLRRVVKELLINACKFRDLDRQLKIRVMTEITPDDKLKIAVSDNGLGVAPDDLEEIFIPFIRLHPRAQYPGNGLGLSICRRILADLNGTIAAEIGPERGLSLQVTVPSCST